MAGEASDMIEERKFKIERYCQAYCEERETERYYVISVEQDLWARWIVVRRWGRKNTKLGGQKTEFLEDIEECYRRFNQLLNHKRKKYKNQIISN